MEFKCIPFAEPALYDKVGRYTFMQRIAPFFTERERAALEWTEALTLVADTHVPDDVYERVREQFSEDELAHLSLAVVAINGWNRLNIAARTVPGDYVPGSLEKLQTVS